MGQRKRFFLIIVLTLLALGLLHLPSFARESQGKTSPAGIRLVEMIDGLNQPVGLLSAGDQRDRLFIIEQAGIIRILEGGRLLKRPFLDIRDRVSSGGEKGLLGLAFHPDFAKNRRVFVNYTERSSGGLFGRLQTVIAEYLADKEGAFIVKKTEKRFLTIPQPFSNHNGGQIAFGPDGMLYIGMGDGGAGNDPKGNAQNLGTLLGKMLRIDVNQGDKKNRYIIPSDNPFTGHKKIAPEIWAYGLRNPWRFSFDSESGRLYLGDVGQNHREEINIVLKGRNYGWNVMEGKNCTHIAALRCDKRPFTAPLFDYARTEGTVVIGGYVYRGSAIPELRGAYLYGDFGNGRIWMLRHEGQKVTVHRLLLETGRMISAFGEDGQRELYIVDYSGKILKIVLNLKIS